jgi:hypothetical protein
MRNYERIDAWLDSLLDDTHPQPPDEGHTKMAREAIEIGMIHLRPSCKSVLDVGCGATGFVSSIFAEQGIYEYAGVCVREDAEIGTKADPRIKDADFTFLDMFPDNSFDIVFARHSLEHSPMPVLTLFEWARIAKQYIWLILPNPEYWLWTGRNHYSVMLPEQAIFLLERVGMTLVWNQQNMYEFWIIAQKKETKEDEN